jgi:hypothetical protein
MRYMRYVGFKNTLLPHLRQRQRSSIHRPQAVGVGHRIFLQISDVSWCARQARAHREEWPRTQSFCRAQ